MRILPWLSLLAVTSSVQACGSVYDTNQPAPSAWVPTYSQPSGESPAKTDRGDGVDRTNNPASGDVQSRLVEAKKLRDDGLISEKEYQQLRKRILGAL